MADFHTPYFGTLLAVIINDFKEGKFLQLIFPGVSFVMSGWISLITSIKFVDLNFSDITSALISALLMQ